MKRHNQPTGGNGPGLLHASVRNPSGVPRRLALRLALVGVGLGSVGGWLVHVLTTTEQAEAWWQLGLLALVGSLGGALLGPLGMLLLAHMLDRTVTADDHLVGYSGMIRMLLHAGELSFLGALGGGIGGGSPGIVAGLVGGVLVCSLVGAVMYRIRGLGLGLGLTIGVLLGAISGALGAAMGQWGS